jgi:hypothetical protein
MALELPFGLKTLNTVPEISKYFNQAGNPYTDTSEVLSELTSGLRHIGLTVNVAGVEYWFDNGVDDLDLVIKNLGGTGDVVGPASSTDNAFALFDGTTGKLIKNSTLTDASFIKTAGTSTLTASIDVIRVSGNDRSTLVSSGSTIGLYYENLVSGKINQVDITDTEINISNSFSSASIGVDDTGLIINLSSDSTGDTYYRNSGGYFTRLAKGSEGTLLRAGASIPAYSTFTIPNTISALSTFVANSANVLTAVTPAAGQSIRVNAGGTAWEAFTPSGTSYTFSNGLLDTAGTITLGNTLTNDILFDGDANSYGFDFVDINAFNVTGNEFNITVNNDGAINTTGQLTLNATEELNLNWGTNAVLSDPPVNSANTEILVRTSDNGYLEKLGIGSGLSVSGGNLVAAGGGSSVLSDLTAATGANTINNANNAQEWQWNSLTGNGMSLTTTSTAINHTAGTNALLRIASSGANASSSRTHIGFSSVVTNTGTTSTNIGTYTEASGATNNLALWSKGGTRLETTTTGNIDIRSSSGADWMTFFNTRYLSFYNSVNSNLRITPVSASGLEFMAPGSNINQTNRFSYFYHSAVTGTSAGTDVLIVGGESNSGTKVGATLSSGSRNFTIFRGSGAWNMTGSYSGTLIGYDYDPTITSGTGLTNLSFRATSGNILLPASSYIGFGTTPNDYGFRDNAGTMEFKNSGGSWAAFGGGSGIGGSTGSVDNALLRADGTGGSTAQSSSVIISDTADIDLGVSGTAGTGRTIQAVGSGSDINLLMVPKGTGYLEIGEIRFRSDDIFRSDLSQSIGIMSMVSINNEYIGIVNTNSAPSAGIANSSLMFSNDFQGTSELFAINEEGGRVGLTFVEPIISTATSYTIEEKDRGKHIYFTSGSAVGVTFSALKPGFFCVVFQKGAGIVTVTGDTNVTVEGKSATTAQHDGIGLHVYDFDSPDTYVQGS